MTRTRVARDYSEPGHQRARCQRDGQCEKPRGCERKCKRGGHGNGHPLQLDQHQQHQFNQNDLRRQLSDQDFFARFSKARFRLRDARPDDGLPDAMTDLLQVLVARSRHGLQKTFAWRGRS